MARPLTRDGPSCAIIGDSGVDSFGRWRCITPRSATTPTRRCGVIIRLVIGWLHVLQSLRLIAPIRIVNPDRRGHPLRCGVRHGHITDPDRFRRVIAVLVAAIVIIVALWLALLILLLGRALLVLPLAEFIDHTVIMIGILQIIFGGDPVPCLLRIPRQRPIFFQQLAGIAPLAIVEPVAVIVAATHLLRARAIVAAAASPVLIVPDQLRVPVFTDGIRRDAGKFDTVSRRISLGAPMMGRRMFSLPKLQCRRVEDLIHSTCIGS